MAGPIVITPPPVQPPPSNAAGSVSVLGAYTFVYAIPNLPQTWSGVQTFQPGTFRINGASSGAITINAAATASGVLTLPSGSTDFSATGGPSQVVMQTAVGAPFTVRQLLPDDVGGVTRQYITAGAIVTVAATDGAIVINKTVGSATTVNLPSAATKVGRIKITDFKGDAGTNNITVVCAGTDTFNGGSTSWVIASNGGSIVCDPIVNNGSSIGYAV